MLLQYDSVHLEAEQVLECSQTPVYSDDGGNDFLFNHIRIRVRAVWNPSATTSYDDDGNPMPAVASIEDLRHRLSQPRKLLKVSMPVGGPGGTRNVLVVSPILDKNGIRFPCDAKNGPCPIGLPVIALIGERTAIVDFAVETWTNECPIALPLLSHRWEEVHDIDEHFMTTRTVQGVAIFRADLMLARSFLPDDFRGILFHPIPNGFKREKIRVEAASDGTALRYTFVDQQQTLTIQPAYQGITRVEAFYVYHKGVGRLSTANTRAGGEAGAMFGPPGVAAGVLFGAALDIAGTFPPASYQLSVRLWGQRTTTRESLINALASLIASFHLDADNLNGLPDVAIGTLSFFLVDKIIGIDLVRKYVEATVRLVVPSEANAVLSSSQGAQVLLPPNPDADPSAFKEDLGNIATINVVSGHAPAFDGGTRGEYVAHLAAQELLGACAGPDEPDPDGFEKYNNKPPITRSDNPMT